MSKEKKQTKVNARLEIAQTLVQSFPELSDNNGKGKYKRAIKKASKALAVLVKPAKSAKKVKKESPGTGNTTAKQVVKQG